MDSDDPKQLSATVFGLGNMGSALVRLLVSGSVPTTVWNRTAARAEPLVAAGAHLETDPRAAHLCSDVSIICVAAAPAVTELIERIGPLDGRIVVNVTWGEIDAARAIRDAVEAAGGRYLDGQILDYPDNMGTPGAVVVYSGARDVFDECASLLAHFGRSEFVGTDPGAASAMGMAGALYHNAAVVAFYEALAFAAHNGVASRAFLDLTNDIGFDICARAFSDGLEHVESHDYRTDQSTVDVHYDTAALQRAVDGRLGNAGTVNRAVCEVLEAARGAGFGSSAMAAVYGMLAGDVADVGRRAPQDVGIRDKEANQC
jgi:3-hydroxyisobutyrate dehydrogenase-like beta-hydroxyacid dehydrogenase